MKARLGLAVEKFALAAPILFGVRDVRSPYKCKSRPVRGGQSFAIPVAGFIFDPEMSALSSLPCGLCGSTSSAFS